jgi:hypothetical protein
LRDSHGLGSCLRSGHTTPVSEWAGHLRPKVRRWSLDFQRHLAKLERYWPKFMIATAIEFGCYLLLQPDLFNLAVIIKTSIMLILWMKGKKQFVCSSFFNRITHQLMISAAQS